MPGVPTFLPAPLVNERDYGQFARKPRPSSASSLPQTSVTVPNGKNGRPSSAKACTPKRPSSAKTGGDKVAIDYSGISNMIKSLNLKKSRYWREKSPDGKRSASPPRNVKQQKPRLAWKENDSSDKNTSKIEKSPQQKKADLDVHSVRRHRSSHYAKFKYPQNYHYGQRALSYRMFLERNIPQCLRRCPWYGNQPKRQSCNFNPPNGVTQIKWHSLRSGPLPAYKGPSVPQSTSTTPREGDQEGEDDVSEANETASDQAHNGNFHYVYEGEKNSDIFYDVENEETEFSDKLPRARTGENYSDDAFEEEENEDCDDDEGPESVEVPVEETPVMQEIEEVVWQSAPKTPRTGDFETSVSRENESDAESIKSWVDPDLDSSYYEKKDREEEHDIAGEDIPDNIEQQSDVAESVHSVKSVGSQHSKASKSSKSSKNSSRSSQKSGSLKFSDSDMRDILDDNAEDPIEEFMNSSKTPRYSGRESRMDTTSEQGTRFQKTVRIQEPVRSPTTPIDSGADDDIIEDYGSDNDQFDTKDLSSLPQLMTMGSGNHSGGLSAGRSGYIRPTSARRGRLHDDDF